MIKRQSAPPRFRSALGFAAALHVFLILALSFSSPPSSRHSNLEVTFSTTRSDRSPKNAKHIAQNNQFGSGTLDDAAIPTTSETAQFTNDVAEDVLKTKQTVQNNTPSVAVVSSKASAIHTQDDKQSKPHDKTSNGLDDIARQLQAIKTLEAKIALNTQAYAQRPRIHQLTSVTAKAAVDADYQRRWQEKIELVGNANYPKSAIENDINGDVRLAVLITPKGTVEKIKLLQSSGNSILDHFAIASVEFSSPFPPFPKELAAKADLLEIIRTWQFRNNTMSAGI